MLTGDSERTVAAIAEQVGVDEYRSEVRRKIKPLCSGGTGSGSHGGNDRRWNQ